MLAEDRVHFGGSGTCFGGEGKMEHAVGWTLSIGALHRV